MRQTTMLKNEQIDNAWFIINAEGQTVGKVATLIASVLRGKHKVNFTPHLDMGDHIVVINAEKVVFSANKEDKKLYYRHSGYPGGLRVRTARQQRAHKPTSIIELAVKRMLPPTILGRKQLSHLHVYAGPEHEHAAQKPKVMEVV